MVIVQIINICHLFPHRPKGVFCWCKASLLQNGLLPWTVQPSELSGGSPGLWEWGRGPPQSWERSRTEVNREHVEKLDKTWNRDFWWWLLDRAVEKWRWPNLWCLPRPLPVVRWEQFPVPVSMDLVEQRVRKGSVTCRRGQMGRAEALSEGNSKGSHCSPLAGTGTLMNLPVEVKSVLWCIINPRPIPVLGVPTFTNGTTTGATWSTIISASTNRVRNIISRDRVCGFASQILFGEFKEPKQLSHSLSA